MGRHELRETGLSGRETKLIIERVDRFPSVPEKGLGSPAARNAALFAVSMLLVLGFWGHGNFYSLGFLPLVLIGGAITFAMLKIIMWANGSMGWGRRSAGTLLFVPDDVRRVQYGSKTTVVRPLRRTRMRAGSIYEAKLSVVSDRSFARLLVTDVYRRRLGQFTEEEAARDGARSLEEFRQSWEAAYGPWNPAQIARVIEFRVLGPSRMD